MDKPFPAYKGNDAYVFVCYAHDDAELVYPEITRLHEAGFHIWYDEGISPGSEWSESLAQHIEQCVVFLYFVTPRSVKREHCRREINFALDQHRAILPVHLEETQMSSALKLSLNHRQAILKHEHPRRAYEEKLDQALEAATISHAEATAPDFMPREPSDSLRRNHHSDFSAGEKLVRDSGETHRGAMTWKSMGWFFGPLGKYAVLEGRAERKECWYFIVGNICFIVGLALIGSLIGMDSLGGYYALAVLIPTITVSGRRLHDTGRNAGHLFLFFIPVVGLFIVLGLLAGDGEPGGNIYGPNPLDANP